MLYLNLEQLSRSNQPISVEYSPWKYNVPLQAIVGKKEIVERVHVYRYNVFKLITNNVWIFEQKPGLYKLNNQFYLDGMHFPCQGLKPIPKKYIELILKDLEFKDKKYQDFFAPETAEWINDLLK